jgi:septal ring factor EnvC (AmiA/AmiB activator)
MPVPWLTVGKLVLANLDTLVNVVRPAFTRKQMHEVADRTTLLDQQIAELQAAATANTEQVTQLAAQLKEVVAALAQSAAEFSAERAARRRRTRLALVMSALALGCSLAALWGVYAG